MVINFAVFYLLEVFPHRTALLSEGHSYRCHIIGVSMGIAIAAFSKQKGTCIIILLSYVFDGISRAEPRGAVGSGGQKKYYKLAWVYIMGVYRGACI